MQPTNYSRLYRSLHWLTALVVFVLIPVGLYMADLPDNAPNKGTIYELHKSFGFIVLLMVALRVFLRVTGGAVAPVPTLTSFERIASSTVHYLLLTLLIIVPWAGFIATSGCCAPLKLFSTLPIGLPIQLSEGSVKIIFTVHKYGAILMGTLALGHAGAALFHHFVRKDNVLNRMMGR
jgi:cytochrome b561